MFFARRKMRGSMHDSAQIKSFFTHMTFLDLVFNEARAEKAASHK